MRLLIWSMPAEPRYIGARTWMSRAGMPLRRAALVIFSIMGAMSSLGASK